MIGFLHAGTASRDATVDELAHQHRETAVHLVEASLVDPTAREFPINEERYRAVLACAKQLATQSGRVILTCSAYNGAAPWLQEDLGIPVERSDAAGARALLQTQGPVGVLLSFPPTLPVVVDYLAEVFANVEQEREIRTAIADAPPFSTSPEAYRDALVSALPSLRGCGVLFVTQYSMHPHVPAIRAAWGDGVIVSAVSATIAALPA
ncbi:MAG: hypothetical protein ACRENA_16120 [Vulcanimicrobiaceae bacterium]